MINTFIVVWRIFLRILTMLNGQNSVKFLLVLFLSSLWSILMRRIKRPLDSVAVKNLLHEFNVLPGLKSITILDSFPSSGRNLSCSWLLHKISLFFVGGWWCSCCCWCWWFACSFCCGNESESMSVKWRSKII